MDRTDWNVARPFCATADAGSLSAAARKIGLTQPTLSRQVAALEDALGVTLFGRIGKKLALTDASPRLPLAMPVMAALTRSAHIGAPGPQMRAVAANCAIAAQFCRKNLPMALKMGFQKQPRKQ